MGNPLIPNFDSSSTSPSSTRPSSPGIARNTSNEGTHSGSTRLDEDFPNEQILTPPNLTFTFAELETAIGNLWREREMGDSWIPHFYSCSTSPSSTRPSSLGIARNTSNEGMHSGSTRLDEDFPNEQILTPPNLTFTFAELETAIGNFWREREMGDSWIPHFYSCSTSPSSTRPSSLGIARNTSNEGTHSGSTRLDEDFPNEQILTPPNLTFTFAALETAIRNFWREREMGDSWIPHFYSCSTSPSSTRPSSLGIARNTSNEGMHSGSTRLDEDFPNEQILTPPNLTFTFAELETAIGNFWREREMGDSWIPHFYSCSTSPSSTRPSSLGIAQNTSNEGTHSGTGSAFSTRLDEDFPNGQILTTPNLTTFTSAESETATRNFRPDTVLWRGRFFKKKIVMKVQMNCQNCRSKAMKIAACAHGVISVAVEGDNQDKVVVVVIGVDFDPVDLAKDMRKKVGHTSILSVEEVKAKEGKKEPQPCACACAIV
ncbi:heavy metal-associated isoprenylated plant protein 47 [Cinnamomum micranthum f. kanehirae]|uniref:Heavy metal-associated isoprenylated plant protein 47 n=1 Tax=Cinnamomum micranthum f. kanehirae TaxID=337451 RepID=A0A3S3P7L9_9MAGN|nr:heavy metal-associated isoprenylated plant protein 47 [Cinnamomum micranthum f. kanehirae]